MIWRCSEVRRVNESYRLILVAGRQTRNLHSELPQLIIRESCGSDLTTARRICVLTASSLLLTTNRLWDMAWNPSKQMPRAPRIRSVLRTLFPLCDNATFMILVGRKSSAGLAAGTQRIPELLKNRIFYSGRALHAYNNRMDPPCWRDSTKERVSKWQLTWQHLCFMHLPNVLLLRI